MPLVLQYYAPAASCSLNIWFITSAILMFLVYGFISISPLRNESAGLFTSAAVFAYTGGWAEGLLVGAGCPSSCGSWCLLAPLVALPLQSSISPFPHPLPALPFSPSAVYYTWSALNSEPTTHACAAAASAGGNNRSIQIIGFVIAIITVSALPTPPVLSPLIAAKLCPPVAPPPRLLPVHCPAAHREPSGFHPDLPAFHHCLQLGVSTMSSGTSSQAFDMTGGSGGDDDTLPYRPDFFHTIFLLASCYMVGLGWLGWLSGGLTAGRGGAGCRSRGADSRFHPHLLPTAAGCLIPTHTSAAATNCCHRPGPGGPPPPPFHTRLQMMLFIGWDLAAANGEFSLDTGWGSTWVKIIAAWLCGLMYTWSLIAHRVLSNRQF